MCGNSICQDRRFLARCMPALEDYFHYRNLDVSTLKELVRRWKPELMKGIPKEGKHEALADILESIDELRVLPRALPEGVAARVSMAMNILQPLRRRPRSNCAFPKATRCRASSARRAARSTTRIRRSSSAACRHGTSACCCASARSSRATGLWTLPAGFLENGETLSRARCARRSRRRMRASRSASFTR